MAGCRPEYFPVVVAAFEAMAAPEMDLGPTVSTTFNGGHLVLVSGPLAEEIACKAGPAAWGRGSGRTPRTPGRAVRAGEHERHARFSRGGVGYLATFGTPAKFTYCFRRGPEGEP